MKPKKSNVSVLVFVASLMAAVLSVPAFAVYTEVKAPPIGEKSHIEILNDIYPGPFSPSGDDLGNGLSNEFTNGLGVTAYRIDDYDAGQEGLGIKIDVLTGGPGDMDQFWSGSVVTITAMEKQAEFNQTLGWNSGGGTNFSKILDWGQEPVEAFELENEFLWADKAVDGWENNIWWSNMADNVGGSDHMVTYKVEGLSTPDYLNRVVWLLFWEDSTPSCWDQDYNDFVVEIKTIPEPVTVCLLGLGSLILICRGRK